MNLLPGFAIDFKWFEVALDVICKHFQAEYSMKVIIYERNRLEIVRVISLT
jgi:hypothetical protein